MLSDILAELVEIYLRRAGLSEETIVNLIARGPDEVLRCSHWLTSIAPGQLNDESIDEAPELEWL